MTLLLNNKFGWAGRLPMIIGGSTCVNITVLWANFGNNQGTAAIFLILYLNWWRFHHRLCPTQPHHLWVRVSCQNRRRKVNMLLYNTFLCILQWDKTTLTSTTCFWWLLKVMLNHQMPLYYVLLFLKTRLYSHYASSTIEKHHFLQQNIIISEIVTPSHTTEMTRKTCIGSWSHCLVLQALGELRWPLHLVLQSLKGMLCFWTKWWVWDKMAGRNM